MKIAMGLRRYETMIPRREQGIVDNRVDDNDCVLSIRTLEGWLLDLAVVANDSKPCHVVAALEGAIRGRTPVLRAFYALLYTVLSLDYKG